MPAVLGPGGNGEEEPVAGIASVLFEPDLNYIIASYNFTYSLKTHSSRKKQGGRAAPAGDKCDCIEGEGGRANPQSALCLVVPPLCPAELNVEQTNLLFCCVQQRGVYSPFRR